MTDSEVAAKRAILDILMSPRWAGSAGPVEVECGSEVWRTVVECAGAHDEPAAPAR